MSKLDIDLIYKAIDEMDIHDDAQVRAVVDYAVRLQEQEKEEKEPVKKKRKQLVIATSYKLDEPIVGWLVEKKPITTTMMNENGDEEDVAPENWGDLELGTRIAEAAADSNRNERFVKKNGKLNSVADVMQYASRKVTKARGFTCVSKEPIAIIHVGDLKAAKEDDAAGDDSPASQDE